MSDPTSLAAQEVETATAGDCPVASLVLSPWTAQNLVLELVANYSYNNPPRSMGYPFDQTYDPDRKKTTIFIDLAYNWDAATVQMRPAIFIQRGDAAYNFPTMGGTFGGSNHAESNYAKAGICAMPIFVKCIATNVGFTENLADYVRQGLMQHQYTIQQDFGFRKFRLKQATAPTIYIEAKEHFQVVLGIEAEFTEGWIIHGDDLKLKTVSRSLFDGATNRLIAS